MAEIKDNDDSSRQRDLIISLRKKNAFIYTYIPAMVENDSLTCSLNYCSVYNI